MIRKLYAIIGALLGAISGAIGLYVLGKKRGKEEEKRANIEEVLKDGLEIKKEINDLTSDPSAVDKQLYKDCRD